MVPHATLLRFLLIEYYLADLLPRDTRSKRTPLLRLSQSAYERFLKLIDAYDMLSKPDTRLYESYLEARDDFSILNSTVDPAIRRETKIARYKQEKELQMKLDMLTRVPMSLDNDDTTVRELYLSEIQLCVHRTFQALDIIAQELQILKLMPIASPAGSDNLDTSRADLRDRSRNGRDGYSERLDPPLSQLRAKGKAGPILNQQGKPLQPFTLLDSRQRLRDGVFRPGHNLPTMTIDEYLEEERRRGGIIDGGGEASGQAPQVDEDDMEAADRETMKKREWDEFTEANPKGSGNTLNRG